MTKYIDADKVIDYANQEVTAAFCYPQGQRKLDEDAYRGKWAFVKQVMVGMPAVDVVEVVRCKDCRHWDSDALCCSRENHYIVNAEANDYCSYGVRRDG